MSTRNEHCETCGQRHRRYPVKPLLSWGLHTELICNTRPGDQHLAWAAGRQYGTITVRVPRWVALTYAKLRIAMEAHGLVRSAFVALLLLAACAPATAKDLYVNHATGNDATTYAQNSAETPWRTIGRAAWGSTNKAAPNAAQAAQAGDVVRIAAGPYVTVGNLTGGGGGRQDVAYGTVNSGTPGAPITFRAEGAVTLAYSSGAGPMLGCTDRNHVIWTGTPAGGFVIDETTAPTRSDTGPVTFFRADGCALEHATLRANPQAAGRAGDNYNGIRLEDARNIRIRHNRIIGYNVGDPRNHSGITTYRSTPMLVEFNHFERNGSGIYLKGTSVQAAGAIQTVTIRWNTFVDNHKGLSFLQAPHTAAQPALVYQNVFRGSAEAGVWIQPLDTGNDYNAKWVRVFNNTFVDNASAFATYIWTAGFPRGSNFLFVNNIVAGSGNRIRQDTGDAATANFKDVHDIDRNVYQTARIEVGGSQRSWDYWQGLGQDAASLVAEPRFISATDYRLETGAAARVVGRAVHGVGGADGTVIPAGAYITGSEQIGPGGSAPEPPPPPPPTPVDCVVSAWAPASTGEWSACVNGQQSRVDTWARTIVTPPANGGAACPALTETRTVTAPCEVDPPPTPSAPVIRLECDHIVSITQNANYVNGDGRWTVRGTCRAVTAGVVVGPPPQD